MWIFPSVLLITGSSEAILGISLRVCSRIYIHIYTFIREIPREGVQEVEKLIDCKSNERDLLLSLVERLELNVPTKRNRDYVHKPRLVDGAPLESCMLSDRDNDSHNAINPFLALQSNEAARRRRATSLTVNYRLIEWRLNAVGEKHRRGYTRRLFQSSAYSSLFLPSPTFVVIKIQIEIPFDGQLFKFRSNLSRVF